MRRLFFAYADVYGARCRKICEITRQKLFGGEIRYVIEPQNRHSYRQTIKKEDVSR